MSGAFSDKASELLEISTQFLSEIERGVKGVSAETLYKICNKFGISADSVLMGK
ncbi:MAG: helix-turn-helix domain-containing protein [Deferribacteraceae bacterium]|jgi:transcriptional regulator with XRE-family HTH domain|nr:helix-turn-helix domain-containing protein [Deferribacteraceae bacterium]